MWRPNNSLSRRRRQVHNLIIEDRGGLNGKSYHIVERKLYLNQEQEATLETWRRECCRIYNRVLEHRIKAYKRRNQNVSYMDQCKLLTVWRQGMPSVAAVPTVFARDTLRRVDRSFKAFFRRVKDGSKKTGFPRFRAQYRYRSLEYLDARYYFRNGRVFIPGIGLVTSRGQDAGTAKQKFLRIIKRASGWYAQTLVDEPLPVLNVEPSSSVGVDVGLLSFAALSNSETIDNPRYFRKSERKLRLAGRHLSRCQRRGKNRVKACNRRAKIYEKIAAQRKDFAHQESRKLVNKFDIIGFEKLNIAGLSRGKFAKSIMDAAWGMFLFFIAYKAVNAGKQAVAVDPRGTSQECPQCGMVKKKSLSERRHECECGCSLDRDYASSLVIETRALGMAGAKHLLRAPPMADGYTVR
jgi:putative transposase